MRAVRALVMAIAALGLSACFVTSDVPIRGKDGAGASDARLVGLWQGVPENPGEDTPVFMFQREAEGRLTLIMAELGGADAPRDPWSIYEAVTAEVKGETFVSLRPVAPVDREPEWPGYMVFRYAIAPDGELSLAGGNQEAWASLVDAGKLAGRVERGSATVQVHLTATEDALRAVLESSDTNALFAPDPKPLRLSRVAR